MSEYQYYEFQTIDRSLTSAEQAEVGALSSHIEVAASRAVVSYNYGSFKHNFKQVVVRYFDAGLYVAEWGTRQVVFRFPQGLLDPAALEPYGQWEQIRFDAAGAHDLLEMQWNQERGWGWVDEARTLSALLPLRNDLLEGDDRALYLLWLKIAQTELDQADVEPPLPAGLGNLTPALERLAAFFAIDLDWIASAAAASPARAPAVSAEALGQAIARLPRAECEALLLRLAQGEPGLSVAFRQQLLRSTRGAPVVAAARRTAEEIQHGAEALKTAAELRRREAAERQRIEGLKKLAKRESLAWQSVETLMHRGQSKAYDDAVSELRQLREMAEYQGTQPEFQRRLHELRAKYQSRHSLLRRLDEAGLTG